MKKYSLVIFWIVAFIISDKYLNQIFFKIFNDSTTGVSMWRAVIPAVMTTVVSTFCLYRAYRALKGKPRQSEVLHTPILSKKDSFSPIQNENIFEYVAIVLAVLITIPAMLGLLDDVKVILKWLNL
jgi:hypothetical protein